MSSLLVESRNDIWPNGKQFRLDGRKLIGCCESISCFPPFFDRDWVHQVFEASHVGAILLEKVDVPEVGTEKEVINSVDDELARSVLRAPAPSTWFLELASQFAVEPVHQHLIDA